jgi:hypothetical protein
MSFQLSQFFTSSHEAKDLGGMGGGGAQFVKTSRCGGKALAHYE